jgi:hypothetical protein
MNARGHLNCESPRGTGIASNCDEAMFDRRLAGSMLRVLRRETSVAPRRYTRERRDAASRTLLEQRVLAEFREMPCLRLTAQQAGRLFGLRADVSQRVIEALIHDGRLRLDDEGRYAAAPLT